MKLSVVIPVYNEEENIPELYRRLDAVISKGGWDAEIIFVDDASKDGTLPLIASLAIKDPRVRCISFSRNFGHQIGVSAGIEHAKGDAVVIMDGDLQDPPETIPDLIRKFKEGYDVVYAVRKKRKGNAIKRIAYFFFYRLLRKIANIDLPLDSGDFSLISKKTAGIIAAMPERNRYVRGLRSWIGFRQAGVEFERDARFKGEAKYSFTKLLKLAYDGIFSFSHFPIKLVTMFGFGCAGTAFLGIIYVLYLRLFTDRSFPAYASTAIIILFLAGIQLISLAIIGEYVGRISDESKRRPLYIAKEKINL